ncbi:uncharacterized protein LOC143276831 [Babylonia areolata]|uniref:uncharacterized protein LOC143276831 n=1 Tax=Babylonia areolata TaxID=304850 RepID=UPI003FD30D64
MTSLGDVSRTAAMTKPTTSSEMTSAELRRQQQERLALRIQAVFVRFLFVLQGVTQLYVTHYYLVDFAFMNLSAVTRWALKLWAWYLCLVGSVNWLCLLYYGNDYRPANHKTHTNDADVIGPEKNGTTKADVISTTPSDLSGQESVKGRPLPWTYCQRCQVDTPPRTRHCKKCEVCIVRRDHHCELVGMCVGHRNQRFFVVLANYGIFVTYIGAYMTLTYLYHHHPEGTSLWNYIPPVFFYQGLRGEISGLQLLLTYHAYMLVAFCPLTLIYFLSEISVILQGKTMHEVMKKLKHVQVSSSLAHRLWLVFGDLWWLNFLFPTVFFLPHKHPGVEFTGVLLAEGGTGTGDIQQGKEGECVGGKKVD